jgi:hypothetical protein
MEIGMLQTPYLSRAGSIMKIVYGVGAFNKPLLPIADTARSVLN